MVALEPFLTAYDPSDLPGSSVDPLGFDRGYTLLADKILPGLTNVASRPRYFSTLCAAILISDDASRRGESETARERVERRRDAILRLERFWTLACALASRDDGALPRDGIRGIRYVDRAVGKLVEDGAQSTDADFRLLSRQYTYGMVGIFGSVADAMGLIDRATFTLGPDLGRRLAESYIEESKIPPVLRRAIVDGGTVGLSTLAQWGRTAHVNATPGNGERTVIREAVEASDTRARMTKLLLEHPALESESEQHRMRRILEYLAGRDQDPDLREALRAILAYEECYRLGLLVFTRLLWHCERADSFAHTDAEGDPVVRIAREKAAGAVRALESAIEEGATTAFREHLDRLDETRSYLGRLAVSQGEREFLDCLLGRHREVQRGKVDRGRPKMPWLEVREGKIVPTLSSALFVGKEPEGLDSVGAHPYRTFAADQFFFGSAQ